MKLTDKIHLLRIDFEITLNPATKIRRFVNVILIFGEKITLIDTGVLGSEEVIYDYIEQNNRNIYDIERIILSHSHPDHIGSAADIKEQTGARVLAHELERNWIEKIEKQFVERPVPGFYNLVDRPVGIDEFVKDGQQLKVDEDITLEFIHSPGHSKGMLNILFKENDILFTADSIPLSGDIPNYDNYPALMLSLQAIKVNKGYSALLTSWTPPFFNLFEAYWLIKEGEDYLKHIDAIVKETYTGYSSEPLSECRQTIQQLGLPLYLVNPLVDKAFRSHLSPDQNTTLNVA